MTIVCEKCGHDFYMEHNYRESWDEEIGEEWEWIGTCEHPSCNCEGGFCGKEASP